MKAKTFILTFLLMMSSPFLFGQHWVDPDLGTDNTMPLSATITLNGNLQTESHQVAAFHGNTLLEVQSIIAFEIPDGSGTLYHVDMEIPRIEGKTSGIYFKLFNTNEYVSSNKIDWDENGCLHTSPLELHFKSVAQIEGTEYDVVYSSLQDAINAADNGNVITLLQDNDEDVTVVQAPNVAFTINGADKTMTGTITVNGKSAAYATAGLTIQNVNFDATNISKDASINLGGSNETRYTNGVTVENCVFTGDWATTGEEKGAIKNYTGGCKNLTINNCTANSLHSLAQLKGVENLTVSGVTVTDCKNGVAVGTSTNVAISGSNISATGYGVRADGEGAYTMTLTDNNISAVLPVVVRKATGNYNLKVDGGNYTAGNENGYQVVFTTGDDGTYEAPTTGQFVLTVPENFNVYPVYVAQVGNLKYTSVVTAINEAADGATVQLLPGTIEEYVYPWPESNHSKEKSITIVGSKDSEGNLTTTLTGGMFLGYDDSQCREHNITVEGINFTGKGLTVACQQYVTIKDNKFNDITEGQAIAVVGENINSVVKNNVIDGVKTSNPGIELRNTLTATVVGNIISNTGHNALQITSQQDATESAIAVTNNTMSNWGTAKNAQGELEGRAMRISNIVTANINGNVMTHTAAPEEFVKVTGATTLDASANYWNGVSPLTDGMFTGVEGDLVPVFVSYYTDVEKTNLVTLAPSVAKIGDEYYQSLQDAIDATTEGQTVTVIANVELENAVTVTAGKVVTLDLNGKTVSGISNTAGTTAVIINKGNLTVQTSVEGGKITTQALQPDTNWGGEGEPQYPTYANNTIRNEGTFTLVSGKIENTSPAGGATYAIDNYGGSTTNINGGEVYCENNLAVRLFCGNNITLNVNGGVIKGTRALWIQLANSNAADAPNVEVNISDGEITATGEKDGYIQALYSYSYGNDMKNVKINISGGTFNGDINLTGGSNKTNIETLNITGGIFNGNEYDVNSYGADEKAVGAISITGGTFSSNYAEKYAIDNGYVFVQNQDGKYELQEFDGFEIPNLDRLIAFRNAVNAGNNFKNKTVTVTADINMESVANWTPIGTSANSFQGTFDGGNFTISNLKVNAPETSNVGLFGSINNGATIKNVTIDNATVKGKTQVGAIAGNLHTSTMDNCHVTGLVQIDGNYKVGGLVGTAYSSVRNSSLIADDNSYVKGTHVEANLEGDNVGGITGYNGEGVYTYSNNTVKNVTISGTRKVGGILGFIFEDAKVEGSVVENVTIESTSTSEYAQANAGKMSIGGIIGQYQTHGNNNGYVNTSVVKNVTFVNNSGIDFQVGPLVGGTRNNEGFVPSATVTSEGNAVYMTTITDSNNLFLMKAVAKIEETNYYTLEEAIAAANNQTVTVLENVELRNTLTIAVDQTVTLDLNGKTISAAITEQLTKSFAAIINKGTLTVKDSGTEGKISVSYDGETFGYGIGLYAISNEGGVLNIEGGIVENTATVASSMYDAIDNNSTLGETVLNISGGEVRCAQYIGVRQFANSTTKDNIVNVTGGKVLGGNTSIWMQNPGSNQPKATIAISGNANIEGRLLAGESEEFVFNVTGGTFTTDVTDFCAPGYVCKQNTDGTYGVFLGVAKIKETGAIYGTLAQAISAAQQGNTITLLDDIAENVTITNKRLTIDGGGFNSTGLIKTSITTAYPLTFQNFNIDGAGYFVQTTGGGGNYTFDNCNIKNSTAIIYTTKATNTVTIKNSTIENCSCAANFVYLNVATFENVTLKDTQYGIHVRNNSEKTIIVNGCDFQTVNPLYIQTNSANKTITFQFEGETDVNNNALALYNYGKLVFTSADAKLVNAEEGLDITTTVEGCVVEYEAGEIEGFGTYSVIPGNVELVRGETSIGKFATIQDAIDAAQNGDVVKIVSENTFIMDITSGVTNSDGYYTLANVANKEVVIDLNGKEITVDVTNLPEGCKNNMLISVFCADVNGRITLKDSGENGSVSVTGGQNTTVYSMVIAYEGLVNIEGGNYSIDYMNEGRGMIYGNVGDGDGNTSNTNQGVNISGGNFTLGNEGTLANGSPWILATAGSNTGKYVYVTGGTYNADILHQYWAFEVLAPVNKALKDNGDDTYTIVDAVAFVRQHEYGGYHTETGYATLEEAFMRAHNAGDIITMLQSVELSEGITVNADQEVVLDLSTYTVSQKQEFIESYSMITNNGKLTIEGNGKLELEDLSQGGSSTWGTYIITNHGELIVNDATLEHLGTVGDNFSTCIPIQNYQGKVTVNEGAYISSPEFRSLRDFTAGGEIIINGGKFNGQIWMQGLGNGSSSLTIKGGEFGPTANDGSSVFITNGTNVVNVSIEGGFFNTKIGATDPTKEGVAGCITGGVFTTEAKENTNEALLNDNFAFVDNGDGTWTVMPTQEQHLVAGWNWYSSYLNIEPSDLTTALGTNATEIKGQTSEDGSMGYDEGFGGLTGSLTLDFAKMYMINTTQACDIKLAADVLNPADHPVTLKAEWNWIGYPSNQSVDINTALANIPEPKAGDVIKTRNSGHAEYAWGTWVGTLKTMIPGEGYMYRNTAGGEREFVYNVEATRGTVEANYTAEDNHWVPNVSEYPFNMTMTAVVDGMTDGNYEVAAFINGEVRGSARPIYVEAIDAYMLFLTINGDEVEEMSFRLYDIDTDTEYDLNDRFNYSNNAHLGSASEPYVFSRGTTGIGEASMSNVNIYPNPTTTGNEINLQATCDTVEVFNALGVKVAEYQNVDTIDALETAGIYVIRITNNGNTQNCRLVVK